MLKTIGKIMVWILLVLLILLGGLALLVRHYLAAENIRALLVPAAQDLLCREVKVGAIEVGLLRGIELRDVVIEEPDGITDFANIAKLSLSYDILPLFHRELAVSEITIDHLVLSIVRDATGRFNFDGIGCQDPAYAFATGQAGQNASLTPLLPLALTVGRIAVQDARVTIRDATGEIPDTDLTTRVNLRLRFGPDISHILFQGTYRLEAEMRREDLRPRISGTGSFDHEHVDYNAVWEMDGESVRLSGEARDYLQAPVVRLDAESLSLDLKNLFAAAAILTHTEDPAKVPTGRQPGGEAGSPETGPPETVSFGTVRIDDAHYHDLTLDDLYLVWRLEKHVMTVSDCSASVAGGKVLGSGRFDLGAPAPVWSGVVEAEQVHIPVLLEPFSPEQARKLSGRLTSHVDFTGSGTRWIHIQKALTADGTYLVEDAHFTGIPLNGAISHILGLPDLADLSFETMDGNLRVRNGQILVSSVMSGRDVRAKADGSVGLDGTLRLPIVLTFPPRSADGEDRVLRLTLNGTLDRPVPVLDPDFLREKAVKALKKDR